MMKMLGRRNFLTICGGGLLGLLVMGSCKETSSPELEIPMPYSLGSTIEKHIKTIFQKGYAYELSEEDFFHGHFLFPADTTFNRNENLKERIFTLEEYFSSVERVMYHTRERLNDWIPEGNNLPRSIVGLMDGSLKIPFFEGEGYKNDGTIHGTDPYEISGEINNRRESTPLINFQGEIYRIWPVFYLTPTEKGRFNANNERYELFTILKEDQRFTKKK